MSNKEKLIEIIQNSVGGCARNWAEIIADGLLANGVTVPVRCKECKHCEIVQDQFDNDWYFCSNTKYHDEVKPDDYCSYGKRKENGEWR